MLFVIRQFLGRNPAPAHIFFAGTLLAIVGLTAPTAALSDTWRDSVREEAQKYDHSDYPEYERPDKQQFLDSYYNSEGVQNTNALVVRFRNGFDPDAITKDLVYEENPDNLDERTSELSNFKKILAEYAVVSFIEPISNVPSEVMEKDRLEAEFFTNRQFPDLRLYYRIILKDNPVPDELLAAILDEDCVDVAEYGLPMELTTDITPTTPNFSDGVAVQRHLDSNDTYGGLGARGFWGISGGTGSGVRASILETAATTSHEDFPSFFATIGYSDDNNDDNDDYSQWESDADHGTSTLGIIGARDNGYGTTGIAPDSSLIFAGRDDWGASDFSNMTALTSSTYTRAGDIISISMEINYCPVVYSWSIRDFLETAIARGVLVFIAAGNTGLDLDDESSGCNNVFNTSAAIVGGGTASPNHCYAGSNYGSPIELQAWFTKSVVTTGGGSLWGSTHKLPLMNFPENPDNPRKAPIPDDSIILVGDMDNSPGTGDDIVSCWPTTGSSCCWHYTKNLTTDIDTDNDGSPCETGEPNIEFQATTTLGSTPFSGNLTWLYVMGNFDNTGHDDIVFLDTSTNTLIHLNVNVDSTPQYILKSVGQGSTTPISGDKLFSGDVNNDGLSDLILSRQNGSYAQWWAAINVFSGSIFSFPAGFQPLSIGGSQTAYYWTDILMFGDYDDDGIDDLIAARNMEHREKEWWYSKGSGDQTFATGERLSVRGQAHLTIDTSEVSVTNIIPGRIDNDNHLDFFSRNNIQVGSDDYPDMDNIWEATWWFRAPIANPNRQLYVANFSGTSAATPMVAGAAAAIQGVFRNDGSSGCDQDTMVYLLHQTGEPQADACNDTKNIGNFPNLLRAAEYLFLHGQTNYVNGYSQSGSTADVPYNADINGDGKDDIFFYRPSNSTFYYSRNLGNRYFSSYSAASLDFTDIVIGTVSMGDVDGDGKDDLVAKSTSGLWLRFKNNTSSTAVFNWNLTRIGSGSAGYTAYSVNDKFMLGDINGDGMDDIIIRTNDTGSWYWAASDGTSFAAAVPLYIGSTYINRYQSADQIRFADVNGDGFDDLVARRSSADEWWISMNEGDNSLHAGIQPVIDGTLTAYNSEDLISVGDYDSDEIADLFVRRPSTWRWYLSKHVSGWTSGD